MRAAGINDQDSHAIRCFILPQVTNSCPFFLHGSTNSAGSGHVKDAVVAKLVRRLHVIVGALPRLVIILTQIQFV